VGELIDRRLRLLKQLGGYRPQPSEVPARREMLALLQTETVPLSRNHFDPGHFTVGAFVLVAGQLLMVHHKSLDMWLVPGGHLDPDDATAEDAAARELVEETGVRGRLVGEGIFDVDVHPIPAARGEPPHRHFNVGYLFTADMVPPVAADDVLAARWVPLGDVAHLDVDSAVARAVAKLQAF